MANAQIDKMDDEQSVRKTREYAGFAVYVCSLLCAAMFLVWAVAPDTLLLSLGIAYYPDRWWAVSIPAWLSVTAGFTFAFQALYNYAHSPTPDSMYTITDDFADVRVPLNLEICDMPIREINRVLYLQDT